MKISVLIPSYRRPQDLARCLESLQHQTRPADQVLVIVRNDDPATWQLLQEQSFPSLPLTPIAVSMPGVVAALNAGLAAVTGDIFCVTDDDAVPHSDWLARIEAHFLADQQVGGVGGRDWLHVGQSLHTASIHPGAHQPVGKVSWYGRLTGNHHIGAGQAREVDLLKGVNMSFRRSAVGQQQFDARMKGTGAEVHFEIAFCLGLKRAGWKLIYDPNIAVDHYLGQRFDADQRTFAFNPIALRNAVHNETLILLEYLNPFQRIIFLIWSVLIGTRSALGIVQWLRFLPQDGKLAGQKWLASLQGRWQGWHTWQQRTS
ncbi:glycosyltransferase family 2 protein [Egbenema bharatensis]|uniref:glycosyltransferase family 2 protein n=1 Tax=Egbenema bharatensis TaxID=3463334 RepID=UPI003A8AB85A